VNIGFVVVVVKRAYLHDYILPTCPIFGLFHGKSNMVKAMDLIIYPLIIRAAKGEGQVRTVVDTQGN
jgi:hypothetical protein